jgi:hypothetical protein
MTTEDGKLYQEFLKTWEGVPKGTYDLKRAAAWIKFKNRIRWNIIRRRLK